MPRRSSTDSPAAANGGKHLVIAEKPSVARDISRVLGGFRDCKEYFESDKFVVCSAVGHLLELAAPLAALPPSRFQLRRVDATTLEVDVRRETLLNAVFAELEQSGIRVTGMRNKTSRLESLFMGLVQGSEDATRAAAAALSAAAGD